MCDQHTFTTLFRPLYKAFLKLCQVLAVGPFQCAELQIRGCWEHFLLKREGRTGNENRCHGYRTFESKPPVHDERTEASVINGRKSCVFS